MPRRFRQFRRAGSPFTTDLSYANEYSVEEGHGQSLLHFRTSRGRALTFEQLPRAIDGIQGVEWRLTAFVESPGKGPELLPVGNWDAIPGVDVTLQYEGTGLRGSTGCNSYVSSTRKVTDGKLEPTVREDGSVAQGPGDDGDGEGLSGDAGSHGAGEALRGYFYPSSRGFRYSATTWPSTPNPACSSCSRPDIHTALKTRSEVQRSQQCSCLYLAHAYTCAHHPHHSRRPVSGTAFVKTETRSCHLEAGN